MNIKNKTIQMEKPLKNLKQNDLFIITTVIYFAIALIYELFYCNYEFFTKQIEIYNFSIYRIIVYLGLFLIFYKFKDKFINDAIKSFDSNIKCNFIYITLVASLIFLIIILLTIYINNTINLKIIISFIVLLIFNLFAIYTSNNIYKNIIITRIVIW